MSFYKTVRLLEGQMVLDNFKLILPLDYEEIIVRYPLLDKGKKKYIEWCKVKSPEKRGIGDYRSINVETIKHGYVDIPDEIKKNWEKGYVVLGRDIMYHYGMEDGEGIDANSLYLMAGKKGWDKDENLPAYLKPSNFTDETKAVFGELYS